MLTLNEFKDVGQTIEIIDSYISHEIYDKADTFDIVENPETMLFKVTLYNADMEELVSFEVDDYDTIQSYLEETFDVEEEDFEEYDYATVPDDFDFGDEEDSDYEEVDEE